MVGHTFLNSYWNEKLFRQNRTEYQNTILCSVTFFFRKSSRYEIMWKNIVEPNRPQMTSLRMRIACWIPKATNTHSEYVIIINFSTATIVARTQLGVALYVF